MRTKKRTLHYHWRLNTSPHCAENNCLETGTRIVKVDKLFECWFVIGRGNVRRVASPPRECRPIASEFASGAEKLRAAPRRRRRAREAERARAIANLLSMRERRRRKRKTVLLTPLTPSLELLRGSETPACFT